MKEKELREYATCILCRKKVGEFGLPLFWRVRVERFGIDLKAVRRQTGLAMMTGATLAQVLGPDEEMATAILGPLTMAICDPCSMKDTCVYELAERAGPQETE